MGPKHALNWLALALGALVAPAVYAAGCDVPDEDGSHWRRAVARIKYLPETEAWTERMARDKAIVQFVLSLDEPKTVNGRCYWPIEIRAAGKPWRRFLVAPVGGQVIREDKQR